MKHVKLFEEFINEARTIEKIEKDRTRVINDMAEMVTNWKAAKASGDKEAEVSFLQTLKDLTEEKKKYEKEINAAIANKDRYIELVISEHNIIFESVMSEIDLLAKEAKTFKDFVKEFKKEYSDLTDAGDIKELEQWLKTVYDSAKNESLSEGKHWHVLSGNTWYTGSDFSTNPADAMKYDDIMSATKVAKKVGGMVHVMTDEEMTKAIKKFGKNESLSEGEEIKKAIHDHWKELYDEDFISEYPKVAKILKNRPHVDRRELARLWDEIYGEDFKEKYPDMWDRMEESEEVSERNAFLGARAKAIEEDLEEFEFNGKMYPVLNKSK